MVERLAFLIGTDPALSHGGETTMFRTLRSIASERYDTEVICLSTDPDRSEPDVVRVPKLPLAPVRLAVESLVRRRSLLHTRFDVDGLRDAVEQSTADRFVAMHCHLAEAYLRSSGARPAQDLWVSTEILESSIWRQARQVGGRVEGRRIRRDEHRVAAAARSVAGYDRDVMDRWRSEGIDSHWLPVTLPPAPQIDVAATPPRVVLLGNRTWRPNADAAELLVQLWPRIAEGIPDAELCLVGPRPAGDAPPLPDGVTDLGSVDDLAGVLATCRVMAAPLRVGGGVRVKLLEAASRGLPVVCTSAAIGRIEASLGIIACRDDDELVTRCRELLVDAGLAAEQGARLHDVNARRWSDRTGHDAVLKWLGT